MMRSRASWCPVGTRGVKLDLGDRIVAAEALASEAGRATPRERQALAPRSPLWRMLASNGLSGKIPLFDAFRTDVERAAAKGKRP